MDDLIQSLQIFRKYLYAPNDPSNFACEHETFIINFGCEETDVSSEDIKRLNELGFFWIEEHEYWCKYF